MALHLNGASSTYKYVCGIGLLLPATYRLHQEVLGKKYSLLPFKMRFKAILSSVLLLYLLDPVVSNPQLNENGFVESRPSSAQNVTYIPNTYIVELEHTPSTKAASLFSQRLSGRVKYHVRKEFNNAKFFYGLSLTVTDGTSQKSDLLEISGVKNVWPVRLVPRPEAFVAAMPNLPSNDTLPHIRGNSDVNRPLKMAGVDKLHENGIKGKGMKIGIIDTGVDYLHPSLGGGFGPGYKISFGYDLVGDDYTGTNTPIPDDDPLVTCAVGGHGTHVAGEKPIPSTNFSLYIRMTNT